MEDKKSVAIIIPVINLWDTFTKKCIDSVISACANLNHRILLIYNASTDNTKEEAGKLVSATFAHKRNEESWSVSKSWNYGIKDAFERGYDYVFVINNDILLHKDSIEKLIERFEEVTKNNENIVLITAMDVRGEVSNAQDIFNLKSEDKKEVLEAESPNFSAFMIKKNCFELVGEFDEGFDPAYFEDGDYHRRIKLLNLTAIVYPQALFYHFGSQTINQSPIDKILGAQGFENTQKYFIDKWGGGPEIDGKIGERLWKFPFNESVNSLKWTKQNPV